MDKIASVSVVWFLVLCCVPSGRAAGSTNEKLADHLAITDCSKYEEQPDASFIQVDDLRCSIATDEKYSDFTYFDNEKLTIGNTTVYSVFQGLINFTDSTPLYCFDENNVLDTFDISFNSDNPGKVARLEFTPCRSGGYWTNGKVFCSPPECSRFLRQPTDAKYFEQELVVTVNMKDLANIPTESTAILKFIGGPDHRVVYNTTANTTRYLSTQEFLDLCKKHGYCYKGKFLNANDLLYLHAGWPPMTLERKGSKVFMGLRHDPREFIYPEKALPQKCNYEDGVLAAICESPSGYHTWEKIWEADLPYSKEWLPLHFFTQWSHKQDCVIRVTDMDTKVNLVDFKGPCGRYVDMKLGSYPYPKIGVFNGDGVTGHVQMRFRDILLTQKGPVF